MTPLLSTWNGFDLKRKAIILTATLGIFAALISLATWGGRKDMALLYANLDPSAASEIVLALEQNQTPFEIRSNAIYVDAQNRDLVRIQLAGSGLPSSGQQGYELLDSLSGFGTTSQMFDATYWRAKEGELARTILAMPLVQNARVHISVLPSRGFQTAQQPSASVTLTLQGASLDIRQVSAIQALVAAAVPNLTPDKVSIIDSRTGLIDTRNPENMAEGNIAALRSRLTSMLEAHVGYNNAIVEITVETLKETETIRERRIDPDSRVIISSEASENSRSSQGNNGSVTVASNLPDGATNSEQEERSQESHTMTNFDTSEFAREVFKEPGTIKRLTVAVLVNQPPSNPRSTEDLTALRTLVAAAVGLDEARGDVLTLQALPFEPIAELGTAPSPMVPASTATPSPLWLLLLPLLAVLGAVLFWRRGKASKPPQPSLPPLATEAEEFPTMNFNVAPFLSPTEQLKNLISERKEDSHRLLQSWLEDSRPERSEG